MFEFPQAHPTALKLPPGSPKPTLGIPVGPPNLSWVSFKVPLIPRAPPDVFHWPCLAGWARALPPRTAPAGHRCPQCGGPLFPPPNLEGPVAEALRMRLRTAPWARPGLGLPLVSAQNTVKISLNTPNRLEIS